MRIRRWIGGHPALALVVCVVVLNAGCVKQKRLRPTVQQPPRIEAFRARAADGWVVLEWRTTRDNEPLELGAPYRFKVLRWKVAWADRHCETCTSSSVVEMAELETSTGVEAEEDDGVVSWADDSIEFPAAYRYRIDLLDGRGKKVSSSETLMVSLVEPPPPPGELAALADPCGILLRWSEPALETEGAPGPGEPLWMIERRGDSREPWQPVAPHPIGDAFYLDPLVAANQQYSYRARSFIEFEGTEIWGEPSPAIEAKAPETLLAPPPQRVWVVPSEGAVEVHWSESLVQVEGYHVYRRLDGVITRLTFDPVPGSVYRDSEAKPGTYCSYAVSAVVAHSAVREGLLSPWVEAVATHEPEPSSRDEAGETPKSP